MLVGGRRGGFSDYRDVDCQRGWFEAAGYATGPTTWQFRGDITGYLSTVIRLQVFDLPRA